MTGEEDEYLTYFSEDRKHFIPYVDAFQKLKYSVESEWNKVKEIKDQKETERVVGTPVTTYKWEKVDE